MAALMATAVVLTRSTVRQAIVLSGYGMVLGLLFLILQAPDVAMSQFGVGTVVMPLLVVLALHATRRHRAADAEAGRSGGGDEGEQAAGPGTGAGQDGAPGAEHSGRHEGGRGGNGGGEARR
ncbi:DUF4040 domain-containing protein [Actinomadura sp. 7K507]|nr:DUF4040 domain-containing protein [Actinomadura sp. 7K507]